MGNISHGFLKPGIQELSKGNDPITNYNIWKTKGLEHKIHYIPYVYDVFYELERKLWNPSLSHRFFVNYWHMSFAIVALYVLAIHLIQRLMRDRKPFTLRPHLIIWNLGLAVFSAFGFWRFGQEFLFVVQSRPFQDSVCLSISPSGPAAFWALCFALSKVAELVDTFFLVLRKRPLIFLHWFHHAAVLIYSWHAATELTAAGRWFIFMNYGVHTAMYLYYSITSSGYRLPKWLSMTITTLQTSQMLVGVAISLFVAILKWQSGPELICQQSNENLGICFIIYASFALLFLRFFHSAYLVKKVHKKTGHQNGVMTSHPASDYAQMNGKKIQ